MDPPSGFKDGICEIFVPVKGAGAGQGRVGTGYPIADNRVLTAAHTLFPDDRDETQPIEISWRLIPTTPTWQVIQPAQVHPIGDRERLDVAIIECEVPPRVRGGLPLSESMPQEGDDWWSEGFAAAGGGKDPKACIRHSFALRGKVVTRPSRYAQFQLTNEKVPTDGEEWQGVSGSPVVANHRIVGVIVRRAECDDRGLLEFTPTASFIDDPEFRRLTGYDERKTRRAAFERGIQNLLASRQALTKALATNLQCDAAGVCGALMEADLSSVLTQCERLHQTTQAGRDEVRAGIADLLNHLLPALYDHGVVEHIRRNRLDPGYTLFELPVGLATLAGIIMASVGRRPFEPRARRNDVDFPHSVYALPHAPEMGFDPAGEELGKAWAQHMRDKFRPNLDQLRGAWHRHILERFTSPGDRRYPEAEVRGIAADELEYRAAKGVIYYFLVEPADDLDWRSDLNGLITEFKAAYPAIVFLRLNRSPDLARREMRAFRAYRDMLPLDDPG